MTNMTQGKWTRIRPLQIDEVDDKTAAAYKEAEFTWGHFPNNLVKVMGYCPRLTQTEIEYANSFIFDPPTFEGQLQVAGFSDRFLKELVISRTSLVNRSRYSVTHHSFIGMKLFSDAGRAEEGHRKLLHLHEHQRHPDVYTPVETAVLNYAAKVAQDAHLVTDEDFQTLREALRSNNRELGNGPDDESAAARFVDTQIVELTWLIGHFCLLNRWFTALQVPDEESADEADFLAAYSAMVPKDIRDRNEALLDGGF